MSHRYTHADSHSPNTHTHTNINIQTESFLDDMVNGHGAIIHGSEVLPEEIISVITFTLN